MADLLSFTTLCVGVATVTVQQQTFTHLVQILRASDGSYRVLDGRLSEPLPSIEAAKAHAENAGPLSPEVTRHLEWRPDLRASGPHEHACPICSAPAPFSARYPRCICAVCEM